MSRRDKLLDRIKGNLKDVRFEELCKLLEQDGWTQRSTRTSSTHYVYKKVGYGRVTIVKGKDNRVKEPYVKEVLKMMGV